MTDLTVGGRTAAEYIRGALYGLAAVSIWSGWIVVARLGLQTSLTPWDIAALRFGVAGLLLVPYVMRRGLASKRLGWIGLAAIVIGGGAPVLLAIRGSDVRACGACGRALSRSHAAGGGASCRDHPARAVHGHEEDRLRADPARRCCHRVGCGRRSRLRADHRARVVSRVRVAWACYTVAMRHARLDGLHVASIAAVGALFLYLPVYFFVAGVSLAKAPWGDLALQAFVQGRPTAIASLVFYGRAVSILGASSGAAFAALSPAMTAVMAIPILGEWPAAMDWIAIVCISVGVYVVSGGPLPQRRS